MFIRNNPFVPAIINFQGMTYKAGEYIHNGGFGVVYRYWEQNDSKTVVVKQLHSSKITEKNTDKLNKAATLWQELGYKSEVQYIQRKNGASIPILIMPDVGKKNALEQLKEIIRSQISIVTKYKKALKTIHDSMKLCIYFDDIGYEHDDATLDNIVYDSKGKPCLVDLESARKKNNSSHFRIGHIASNISLTIDCLSIIQEETPFSLLLGQLYDHLREINDNIGAKKYVLEVCDFLQAEIRKLENCNKSQYSASTFKSSLVDNHSGIRNSCTIL